MITEEQLLDFIRENGTTTRYNVIPPPIKVLKTYILEHGPVVESTIRHRKGAASMPGIGMWFRQELIDEGLLVKRLGKVL